MTKISQKFVLQKAQSLIDRYGRKALDVAKQKADEANIGKYPSDKDFALAILTKVEELTGKK